MHPAACSSVYKRARPSSRFRLIKSHFNTNQPSLLVFLISILARMHLVSSLAAVFLGLCATAVVAQDPKVGTSLIYTWLSDSSFLSTLGRNVY